MLKKHPIKNPLRGLVCGGYGFLQRCCRNTQANKSYGTQEGFEVSRLPRSIRFGWETEPTGLGWRRLFFLKLTPMVR